MHHQSHSLCCEWAHDLAPKLLIKLLRVGETTHLGNVMGLRDFGFLCEIGYKKLKWFMMERLDAMSRVLLFVRQ